MLGGSTMPQAQGNVRPNWIVAVISSSAKLVLLISRRATEEGDSEKHFFHENLLSRYVGWVEY